MRAERSTSALFRAAITVGLCTLLLGASSGDQDLHCEAAMARLAQCCPGFDPGRRVCESSGGCNGPSRFPDFDVADSECIEALDCDAVVSRGLCETVSRLPFTVIYPDPCLNLQNLQQTCAPPSTGHGHVCAPPKKGI